jgi:hypothetical protein
MLVTSESSTLFMVERRSQQEIPEKDKPRGIDPEEKDYVRR